MDKHKTGNLHKLLNAERRKRRLKEVRWNQSLWKECKEHSNYMARVGQIFHESTINLPNGGECVFGGRGNHSPETIAKAWMKSYGHAILILDPDITSWAVAITDSKDGTYATWRGIRTPKTPLSENKYFLTAIFFGLMVAIFIILDNC